MQNTLIKLRGKKKILIAAHRGSAAGNIPCNTKKAFDTALYQGADILETDITVSRDGTIFVFHPKREKSHLNLDVHLEEMESSEIRKLRYVNFDNIPTEYAILTLDDFLETYKNRCVIHLDHAWDNLTQVLEVVKLHNICKNVCIEEFRSGNLLMFSNNRKTYIEEMQGDVVSAFVNCQNKRFNIFDEEMAIITAQAYTEKGNFEKSQFIGSFKDMWERNVISQDMQVEESLAGFCKLRELLNEIKQNWEKEGKVFAVCHTDDFVKNIEDLETKLRDNAMSAE